MLNRLIVGLLVIKVGNFMARWLSLVAYQNAQLEGYTKAMYEVAAGGRDLYGLYAPVTCPKTPDAD